MQTEDKIDKMEQRNLAVDDSLSYVYGYCRLVELFFDLGSRKYKTQGGTFGRLDDLYT